MNLGERINIIVSEFDGVRDGQPIVWECNAGNTAGFTEDKARQLSANGGFGKVFVGSISASCLTEITPWGKCETEKNTIKNRAGVRFTPLYSDSFKLKSKTVNFDDHLKHELAQRSTQKKWPKLSESKNTSESC